MMEMPVNAIKLIFTEPVLKARSVSFEISNIPLASVEEMLDLANGALRFLDLAVLPSVAVNEAELGNWESLERCLSKCNVIKTTLQAAKELTNDPCASSSEIALHLREKFQVAYVAITDGVNGAVVAFKLPGGKHFASHIPLPSNFALTDAFGAEDAFYGGLIAGFCHWGLPEDIESATRIGKLAGATRAACCETLGGFPSDESYYRVQKFLPMGFPSGCNRIHPHPCKPLSIDQLIVGPIASLSRDIDALLV
jgi:sugar/nucleoside kinase (ribokinase family)